jgi:rod shape-determining protein MreC
MDSFFSRYKNPLVLIALIVAQIVALAMQVQRPVQGFGTDAPDSPQASLSRRWISATVTPIERILHGSSVSVRNVWSNYIDLRHTRQQDAQLRLDLARVRGEEAAFSEDAAQGRRLQKLLDFKQQYVSATVAAQVIGTSGSDRSRLVLIDKGAADGLKTEQAVITPDGVVGKIRDVFPHTAQVLLISDPYSGAGVILASTRIRGIIRGTVDGDVQINNLTADSRIKPGEQVLTSGGDLVFPRGLPVGVIQSIAPDAQHQPYTAITIKPAANLTELEEVLVITGTQSSLPPSAQQDAAAAQQRAEDLKRAADLVAEKLPSLHPEPPADPTKPADPAAGDNQVGGVAGVPNSGLPRPRPALHPDRYSPGGTPPADSLTPGAAASPSTSIYTAPPRVARPATKQPAADGTTSPPPTSQDPPQDN